MSIRRAPAGIPAGGQFAAQNLPETSVWLAPDAPLADPFDEVQRAEAAALATGSPGSYRAVIAAMECVDPDLAADPAWRLDAFNDTRMRMLERAELRDMEEHDGPGEMDRSDSADGGVNEAGEVDEAQEAAQIAAAAAVSSALSRSMGIEPDTDMPTVLFRHITDVPQLAADYRSVHGAGAQPDQDTASLPERSPSCTSRSTTGSTARSKPTGTCGRSSTDELTPVELAGQPSLGRAIVMRLNRQKGPASFASGDGATGEAL